MKGTNEILLALLILVCVILLSCKTSSVIDYKNLDKERFLEGKVPIVEFENSCSNGNYIFAVLSNSWESYLVVFSVLRSDKVMPHIVITDIQVLDEKGNEIFFSSELNSSVSDFSKGEKIYRKEYSLYGISLIDKIPSDKLTENQYSISFTVDRKKMTQTYSEGKGRISI